MHVRFNVIADKDKIENGRLYPIQSSLAIFVNFYFKLEKVWYIFEDLKKFVHAGQFTLYDEQT